MINNMFTIGNKHAFGHIPWNKGLKGVFKHSEETKRKISITSKGRKHSKETIKKMSEIKNGSKNPMYGKHHSEEHKRKIGLKSIGRKPMLGKKHSEETKEKMSKSNTRYWSGKQFSKDHKRKLSDSHKGKQSGEKNPGWQGGKSFEPYSLDWTKTLKLAIRQRDKFTCQKCGITEEEHIKKFREVLSVNHIDFNKKNCDPKNLNTLCRSCNASINYNREYWTKHFQEKIQLLYIA